MIASIRGLGTIALISIGLAAAPVATAQRTSSDVAVGAQFGSPSGIGLRLEKDGGSMYDFVAAWDLNDFFFLNGHLLFDRPLGQDRRVTFFYGPGGFVGIRDGRPDDDNEASLGVSVSAGISFRQDPLEIQFRLTPRIAVVPNTNATIGGGLGLYYWF